MSDPGSDPVAITSTKTFGEDQPDPDETLPDPLPLLGRWLPENTDRLRPLMTLSTIGADGYPDSRNVLLSEFDGEALYFHTDAQTRKASELAVKPRVSITFVWAEHGRQLTVVGDAEPTSAEHAAAAFASCSRYLQLLAWSNTAESAGLGVAARRAAWAAFAAEHPDGTLEAPPTWVGYRVTPRRITFWRGDLDGPSNRVEYTRAFDHWSVERLPG